MDPQILLIIDPLTTLNLHTDTTLSIAKEACDRKIDTYSCELKNIFLKNGKAHFKAVKIGFFGSEEPAIIKDFKEYSIDDFNLVLMRKDPPVDQNFISALLMLRCHDQMRTHVVNDPDSLLMVNEKLFGLQIALDLFPKTIVSSSKEVIFESRASMGTCVLKPLFSSGGSGVMVFEPGNKNFFAAVEILSNNFTHPIIIQSYLDKAKEGDKRIFLLGGEVLGAIGRRPACDDHRANIHAGGKAYAVKLSASDHDIVKRIGPSIKKMKLHLVGLDIIGEKLIEINVTSPTCIREMEGLMQISLRAKILDYLMSLIA